MIYISSESLFIKVLTTNKMFLAWLNINLELLKIGCNQTKNEAEAHAYNGFHPRKNPPLSG